MLKNLDLAQNVGGFVTRSGYSRLSSIQLGAVRGGVRWYYNKTSSQLILGTGNGLNGKIYRWDGGDVFTAIGPLMSESAVWNFPYSQDLLFILNGVDAIQRWDGTTMRAAGFVAPTGVPAMVAGAAGVLTGAYQYVYTYVYDSIAAKEGSASPASVAVTLAAQQGSVSGITVGPAGVTSRNIYRTKAGGTLYYFLASIADNTTTTYTDNIADSALGSNQAPTDNAIPPSGAQFGIFWRGRLVLASTPTNPQRVFMSAVTNTEKSPGGGGLSLHGNGIEIFPASHFIDVGDDNLPITGLAIIMDQLVVFKQQRIYNVQGTDAVDMEAWVADGATGCIAPKSILNMGGSLMFLGRVDGVPTVYGYDGYKAEPLSTPIEPTLKSNIDSLAATDTVSVNSQPAAFKYRGMYGLCYPTDAANQKFEIAILDTRPPQPRWQFWTITRSGSCWIPWNGPGDKGELYFGDLINGVLFKVDVGSQDVVTTGTNITATIKTKPMDLGHPGVWKQVHRIEVHGLAVAGTTVQVDRYYNRDTVGILGTALTMAAPVDDVLYKNLALAVQDCASADDPANSPEQGDLVQLVISLVSSSTGQAEISKIEVIFQLEGEGEVRRPS